MKAFLRRLGAAYGSAIILMFFSEYFFLNEGPVSELLDTLQSDPVLAVPAFISFAGFYTLFTYPMLVLLSYYNVRTLSGLLLAGAVFGWATEGSTIPVIYEAIPVSFVFPSIGWHALIDVLVGWYFVRLGMRRFGVVANGAMFIVLGALWGMWATWFWGGAEADAMAPLSPADFALVAVVSSGFWLLGMVLADHFSKKEFRVSKWEVGVIGLIYIVLVPLIAFPYLPLSLLIVPVVALTILALWRGRNFMGKATILERLHTSRPPRWSYILALLTPATAVLIYPWFFANEVQVPTEDIVVVLLLAGLAWF
ncbi:MAG TPA: hypothetical protein ENJ90_11665, partial [Devosia sp.]|nr:hypothetical protein [Devosia sp.]